MKKLDQINLKELRKNLSLNNENKSTKNLIEDFFDKYLRNSIFNNKEIKKVR